MIKKYLLAAVLSVVFVKASAQNIKLVSSKGNEVVMAYTQGAEYGPGQAEVINGIHYKKFQEVLTMQKGAPALPVSRTSVQVPGSGTVALEINYSGYSVYQGVNILPSKGSLTRNVNPKDIPYEFGQAYSQDAFYPGNLAEASNTYTFRDTHGVTVSIYPYQYNPVTKVLRVYHQITVKVVSTNGTAVKKTGLGNSVSPAFAKMYSNYYLNGKTLGQGDQAPAAATKMLIVAPDEYVDNLRFLADWKIESGISTIITPLSQIGYTPEQIKAYIQEYYVANPELVYVLLAGDHGNLPSYSYGTTGAGEELWSDTYYAQLEGDDFYPEVLIGRFSGTVTDVANMVTRTLEYETAPLEGNWMTRVAGIGSNEGDGYGDDGEPDWQHLRNIGNKLLAHGYTYSHEFFDGSHGGNDQDDSPSNIMISEAVNNGVGLINYTGHGGSNEFSTGIYTNTNVFELTNTGKYPFVVSVACNNGTFTTGTSICEAWLTTQNNGVPTGAIAACGSSILMAWAEPMQTQDEMTELIIGSNPQVNKYTLGDLFYSGQLSMLETYGLSQTALEIMQTWVFFGDPSVTYRNAPNQALAVTHAAQISSTAATFTVTSAVEGAAIAITQNGVIVGTGTIINGQAVVSLTGFDPSLPLTVTATMQNYTPYQGSVATTMGADTFALNSLRLYPNPAGAQLTVSHNLDGAQASYKVFDVTGKIITTGNIPAGTSFGVDTSRYASGVYLLTVESNGAKHTRKFIRQ